MHLKRSWAALLSLVLVAGCSTLSDGMSTVNNGLKNMMPSSEQDSFKVESEPSGAAVYVMGEKVGTTPMRLSSNAPFPVNYDKEKQSLYGKVFVKKSGCADYMKEVSAKVLSVGVKAALDCGDLTPAAQQPARANAAVPAPRLTEGVEQRLKRIKDLQDKGMITEEEAKGARARVINDL